jgi:cytochrome c553
MRWLVASLCLSFAAEVAAQSEVLAAVSADLRRLPEGARISARYLRLDNIPADDREKAYQAIAGHLQHLSTATDITPPAVVQGTAGALLRLNLDDYYIAAATWERLADADPYDHVKLNVTEPWPGGTWPGDGTHYAAGSFPYTRTISAFAPVGLPAEHKLLLDVAYMTHSRAPVLRADWFFNQTAAQQGRNPGYYDFLGIKDKKTFEALGGFDAKRSRRKIEYREAVGDSGVTAQPRAIARFDADEGGVYWYSVDFKRAVDKQNPLRVLGKDIEQHADAFETYVRLPNGFWATGAFNGKGERQDVAPADVAADGKSKSNDKQVHVNASCTRCHDNGGLKDVDGWTKNLFAPPLALNSPRLLRGPAAQATVFAGLGKSDRQRPPYVRRRRQRGYRP